MVGFEEHQVVVGREALLYAWEEFLRTYQREQVEEMALAYPDRSAVVVPYWQLDRYDEHLAEAVLRDPGTSFEAAEDAVAELGTPVEEPVSLRVRVVELPAHWRVPVRELRAEHLGRFVAVQGLVRKATEVRPRLAVGAFECLACGHVAYEEQNEHLTYREPQACPQCEKKSSFRLVHSASTYVDTQRLEVQEAPEGLRGGEQPERLVAFAEGALCGDISPGDRVVFNGVLRPQQRRVRGQQSTLFDIFLEVNSYEVQEQEFEEVSISEEEEQEILRFADEPGPCDRVVESLAPTIAGMRMEKQALALQLVGGVTKHMPDGSRVRGDIHVLLVGDPGVAKSQLLRHQAKLAPRSIYTSGKSSSAAGLTAAAVRDELADGRWTLEAGALVLADKGICCVDEIDKMEKNDRSSMHEAMEQQTISVAKAGIQAELKSRCAILGAANPKFGRFDVNVPLAEQITMEPALMSRFDMIFTLTDKPDQEFDAELANHIMAVHRAGAVRAYQEHHEDGRFSAEEVEQAMNVVDPPVSQGFLRRYVAYARRTCYPVVTREAREKLESYYVDIRKGGHGGDGAVPMTARQLEALVRLAEASAKIRLSNRVEVADATRAVEVMEYWLTKLSGASGIMDIDLVTSGVGHSQRERVRLIKTLIEDLASESQEGASLEEVVSLAGQEGVTEVDVRRTVDMLRSEGEVYCPTHQDHYKVAR